MWHDLLKDLGLEPKWSTREKCYFLEVGDEDFGRVSVALNGMYTLYEAARDRHVYDGANPLSSLGETPNRSGRRAARSLFRIKRTKPRTMRTMVASIVERIRRAGRQGTRRWPPSVTMLIDLMIEGLARLSEQIALTLKTGGTLPSSGKDQHSKQGRRLRPHKGAGLQRGLCRPA
jgi:hypothetical protein